MIDNSPSNYAPNKTGFDPSQSLLPSEAQGSLGIGGAGSVMGSDGMPMGMMTCEELLVWLNGKLEGLGNRMREKMDVGDKNAKAQTALNDVTRELNNIRNGAGNAGTAADAIRATLAAHGSDGTLPPALKDKLAWALEKLDAAVQGRNADPAKIAQKLADAAVGSGDAEKVLKEAQGVPEITDQEFVDLGSAITTQTSELDQLSQQNLTEINLLASKISQATGLVSAMMASFNDAAKGVISNMRG